MIKAQTLYKQISKELLKNVDKKKAEKDKIYHKYPFHKSLGLRIPQLNKILKIFKKDIDKLNCKESLHLVELLAKRKIEEFVLASIYILQNKINCLTSNLLFIDHFAQYFISWSTVDDFCIDILQPILRKKPKQVLDLVSKWNKSSNLWKKRASMVVFTRKIGKSGQFTEELIKLCNNLIWDKNDLVQKAVGWALKDAMYGDKKERVLNYVKELRKNRVSSTIILYAIRNLKDKERSEVLNI